MLAIGYGIVVLIFLPPVPERLRYGWTADEKIAAVIRTQQANNTPGTKIRWKEVLPALKAPMLMSLALAGLLWSSSTALAQPAPDQPPAAQGATAADTPPAGGDRYGGGSQTLAEFQARYRERVMRADADHDGRISLAEWTAAHPPRDGGEGGGRGWGDPSRQFQMLDADHDGFVTPAEIDASSAARFARMDANHDGVLTPDERMAMRHGGGRRGGADAPSP